MENLEISPYFLVLLSDRDQPAFPRQDRGKRHILAGLKAFVVQWLATHLFNPPAEGWAEMEGAHAQEADPSVARRRGGIRGLVLGLPCMNLGCFRAPSPRWSSSVQYPSNPAA